MPFINETPTYEAGIYEKETTDQVIGGDDGISNIAEGQLANRTAYLKQEQDGLKNGQGFNPNVIGFGTIGLGVLSSHIRNTILTASVNAQGFANFLTSTSFTDQVRIVASAEAPLILSAADGYDGGGARDFFIRRAENLDVTITGVPVDDTPIFMFRRVNTTTGAVNTGFTNIPPVYGSSATHLNGRMWFNTRSQRWFQSDGAAWSAIEPRVFLGAIRRNSSGEVTQVIPYEIRQEIDPQSAGVVQMFANNNRPPYGWDWCRGQEVDRLRYPALFAAIGTTYGEGDESTTFNLPDTRGEFVRGFDNTGAISNTAFGQKQDAAFPAHAHFLGEQEVASGSGATVAVAFNETNDIATSAVGTSGLGAGGLRPRNIALNYIIKLF